MLLESWIPWIAFNAGILALLALDLGVFHRRAHAVSLREALAWSGVWIALALLFNAGIYFWRGPAPALDFLTGYVLEKSLAIDNIFVILLVFNYFRVPQQYQHKVLFWGILGALVMRAAFIWAGVALIERFHWMLYLFGGLLVVSAVKMILVKEKELDPDRNPVMRLFRRIVPTTNNYVGGHFLVREAGRWVATPLLVALVFVELSDLIFAVDSIPAILAITQDQFIVYTSNALAILGLRSLYFAVGGLVNLLHYLHYGLAAILMFVGAKMLLADFIEVPVIVSLAFIVMTLLAATAASLIRSRRTARAAAVH